MASTVLSVASHSVLSPSASLSVHETHKVPSTPSSLSHITHLKIVTPFFYDWFNVGFEQGKLKFGGNGLRFSKVVGANLSLSLQFYSFNFFMTLLYDPLDRTIGSY